MAPPRYSTDLHLRIANGPSLPIAEDRVSEARFQSAAEEEVFLQYSKQQSTDQTKSHTKEGTGADTCDPSVAAVARMYPVPDFIAQPYLFGEERLSP